MTYSDLYTTVTQYNTNLQRSSPTYTSTIYKISGTVLEKPICETQLLSN